MKQRVSFSREDLLQMCREKARKQMQIDTHAPIHTKLLVGGVDDITAGATVEVEVEYDEHAPRMIAPEVIPVTQTTTTPRCPSEKAIDGRCERVLNRAGVNACKNCGRL